MTTQLYYECFLLCRIYPKIYIWTVENTQTRLNQPQVISTNYLIYTLLSKLPFPPPYVRTYFMDNPTYNLLSWSDADVLTTSCLGKYEKIASATTTIAIKSIVIEWAITRSAGVALFERAPLALAPSDRQL